MDPSVLLACAHEQTAISMRMEGSSRVQTSGDDYGRQSNDFNPSPREHWTARSERFRLDEITCNVTHEESEYLVAEFACDQGKDKEEMSASWLAKELLSEHLDEMVGRFPPLSAVCLSPCLGPQPCRK